MGRPLNGRDEARTVTKAELGTKRLCPNCGARYYDLNRDPIVCPRCGTAFEVAAVARVRPQTAAKAPPAAVEDEDEDAVSAEMVSLEEADDETADSGAVVVPGGEDEDVDADDDDDTFLAEEEEDDEEDVGDIIGDVDEEEP